MDLRYHIIRVIAFLLFMTVNLQMVRSEDSPKSVASEPERAVPGARKVIEHGLAFLLEDAAEWRKEHQCSTCHHGTMTVWALSEAKNHGFDVADKSLRDQVAWTKERLKDIDKPRDKRPGWNMVNSPSVMLATMAQAVPTQDAISDADLKRIAAHLMRHQEADGSWAWSIAPAKNRPPPFFESDEVVTVLAYLALAPHVPSNPSETSDARAHRERAAKWLAKAPPGESTQATALHLFRKVREGEPPAAIAVEIGRLLGKQNKDGGWGQEKDLPSDAYATGQALYFLSLAGVNNERAETQRAVSFLVATQHDDGSWPMTSRAHPGAKPFTNPVPITYFGSAWATMGLVRSMMK